MGIQHFKAGEHSPEAKSAIKFADNVILTSIDRELQSDTGTRRLLPTIYVVEKGKPYTYTALGPSVCYIIEGEHELEDQSTPAKPILLTKGDVALADEGTVIKASSPSNARVFGVSYVEAPSVLTDTLS